MDTLAPARSAGENCVRRRRAPGELASDSEAPKGSKRLYVNAAGVRGKLSYLIRGDLRRVLETRLRRSRGLLTASQKSAEAEVVDGVTTIQGEQRNLLSPNGQELGRRQTGNSEDSRKLVKTTVRAARDGGTPVRDGRPDTEVNTEGVGKYQGREAVTRSTRTRNYPMPSSALLTWPNRRMRTRMSGGVGGEKSRGSPLSQFGSCRCLNTYKAAQKVHR